MCRQSRSVRASDPEVFCHLPQIEGGGVAMRINSSLSFDCTLVFSLVDALISPRHVFRAQTAEWRNSALVSLAKEAVR